MSDQDHVRFFLSRESKRKIYSAMILSVIAVLTIGQAHAGFLVVLLMLPLTIWLAWSAYVIVRHPYARLAQSAAILVWAVALGLLAGAHYARHSFVRDDADSVVREIRRYMADYGRCPQQLETLGYKRSDLIERLGENFTYACEGRKPRLAYVATFTIFDTFEFDFDAGRWRYISWAQKKKFLDTGVPGLASPAAPSPPPGSPPALRRTP